MPLVTEGDLLRVDGVAGVEDAEVIVAYFEGGAPRVIGLDAATHLHAAVLQVLMAYRPALADGPPADAALAAALWFLPPSDRQTRGRAAR